MSKSSFISDHALLRWIERIEGVDVEKIRDQIAATPGLLEAADLGATRFAVDGAVFIMARHGPTSPMIVTTIIDGSSPSNIRRQTKTKSTAHAAKKKRATIAFDYEDEDEMAGGDG